MYPQNEKEDTVVVEWDPTPDIEGSEDRSESDQVLKPKLWNKERHRACEWILILPRVTMTTTKIVIWMEIAVIVIVRVMIQCVRVKVKVNQVIVNKCRHDMMIIWPSNSRYSLLEV